MQRLVGEWQGLAGEFLQPVLHCSGAVEHFAMLVVGKIGH
jgi:hypothetical protein